MNATSSAHDPRRRRGALSEATWIFAGTTLKNTSAA
jgi:hypothetical protein